MTADSVTRSRKLAHSEPQVTPIVTATENRWISGRKLHQTSYLGICPGCDTPRLHLAAGLRRCPGCGTHYTIVATPAGTAA